MEWIAFYTSKVELGTGTITALAQIVAEELNVPFHKIQMDSADTSRTIEQGSTVGSRTIERAGPQIRQAAAAARQELLKLAAAQLNAPIEKLTVAQGIVSVAGDSSKKISYGELIGGKKFNTKITATGTGWDMKVAPEVKAKNPKDYKGVGKEIKRTDLPTKVTGEHDFIHRENLSACLRKPNGLRSKPQALKVTWAQPTSKVPATADGIYKYLRSSKPVRSQKAVDKETWRQASVKAKSTKPVIVGLPNARHDRPVMLYCRCQRRQSNDLVGSSRTVPNPRHHR